MHNDKQRDKQFQKNEFVEKHLRQMNLQLGNVEAEVVKELKSTQDLPLIFIVGVHRSGTTLLNQLLINNFDVSYPNNFIARFWNSPILGAMLYQSMKIEETSPDYASEMGYTKGLNGPHEFNYFWRHWFPEEAYKENFKPEGANDSGFCEQLTKWAAFMQKPLVFKNLHQVDFRIAHLSRILPQSLFIHIEREPYYVAQSTYESRLKLFGDAQQWFGIYPPESVELMKLEPLHQIAGQVYFSDLHIRKGLDEVDEKRKCSLRYETLIEKPESIIEIIKELLKNAGYTVSQKPSAKPDFKSNNSDRFSAAMREEMKKALGRYF